MTRVTRNTVVFLLITLLFMVTGAAIVHYLNERELHDSLAVDSRWIGDDIESLLRRYEHGLRGERGAILAIGEHALTRERLLRYMDSRDLATEFPWAGGFGFIRHVPLSARAAYEQQVRQGRMLFASITQLSENPGELYVIEYIEPMESNRKALGLDIASSQARRSAADHAMLTGRAELTNPIRLVQKDEKTTNAYLFLLPIYAGSVTPPTVQERQDKIIGWAYAPLSVHEIISELSRRWKTHALEVLIEDVASDEDTVELFRSDGFDALAQDSGLDSALSLYGRAWKLQLRPSPEYRQAHQFVSDRAMLLSCGSLLVLALVIALAYQTYSRREEKLQQAQALLAAVVDSSPDAIVTTDAQGRISSWNRGAADYLQCSPAQALNTPLAQHPDLRELDARAAPDASAQVTPHIVSLQGAPVRYASAQVFSLHDRAGRAVGKAFMLRDITHEKNIERQLQRINEELEWTVQQRTQALHQAKTMLQTVLNVMPSLVAYWDRHLINHFANAAYERAFHREAGQLNGVYMPDLVGPALFEKALPHIEGVLAGQQQTFERTFDDPALGARHMLTTYIPEIGDQGEVTGFYVVAHDVTEITHNRNQLWEALAQNQSLLDQVQDANTLLNNVLSSAKGVAIIATDTEGLVTLFNSGAEQMLGYRTEDVVGKLREEHFSSRTDAAVPGQDNYTELLYRRRDGATLPVARQQTSMFDHRQRHLGYLYIALDVSLQRQQAAALAAARDQLVLAAEVAKLGVWVWDKDSDTLEYNRQIAEIYGIGERRRTPLVTTYAGWRRWVHPEDVDYVETALQEALDGSGDYEPVFRVVRDDGDIRYVQARAHVERDGMGRPVRVIGINLDITQRIEFENNLVDARLKAEQANSAKSLFLASVSHEIRTPMNGVLGMIQLLQRTQPLPGQQDYLDKAEISAKSLLNLLNDLLDFSKMDAEQLRLDLQSFELERFGHDLAAVLAGSPPQAGVSLHIALDPQLPRRLVGDAHRLQQVLVNLAGNALKFTHQGRIDVRFARLDPLPGRAVALRVEVSDTGIGIAADRLDDIFDAFTQAEASTTRRYGGTGLGLAISKHLVGLMGGQLQVSSEPGRGSRFWFDLQLQVDDDTPLGQVAADDATRAQPLPQHAPRHSARSRAPETARTAPDEQCLQGVQILLVEDNPVNRQVASELLALSGAQVSCADNGSMGVAMACDPTRHFDLVLMDLQMPGMDGIEATRRIRGQYELRSLPILAMTANASPEDKQRCIEAGMAGHIAKPIDIATLIPVLLAHLQQERPAPAAAPQAAERQDVAVDRHSVEDYASILRRFQQATQIYRTTLEAAGPELERLLAQYRAALAMSPEQAMPALAQASHALRGVTATIGARGLAVYFGALELHCRQAMAEQRPDLALLERCRTDMEACQHDAMLARQQLLTQALRPPSSSAEPPAAAVATVAAASDFPDRQRLRELLLSNNLEALDLIETLGKRHGLMQQEPYRQLNMLIEKLDFATALACLDHHFGDAT
ncbi:PAS domain S-box protein [Herbaspirillum seropedicae]|uniref:CHASE domain-containing protein n=1 Tax=Herbaspirillum seropedicae TaxID=964 RepID=UPI00111FBD19|nr:CHASE domain-containing protein [Herbaspirillum seropedicae]QDD66042.1 PAS domain S-box protein [Herbaspirillum seropedicae]